MARIYIPYSTGEGQTAKIAEYIADVVRAHGHEAQTADMGRSEGSVPSGYDGVIVGASIHMGKHDKHAVGYVRDNRTVLEELPSAFFSVSLSAADSDEESMADLQAMIDKFIGDGLAAAVGGANRGGAGLLQG